MDPLRGAGHCVPEGAPEASAAARCVAGACRPLRTLSAGPQTAGRGRGQCLRPDGADRGGATASPAWMAGRLQEIILYSIP